MRVSPEHGCTQEEENAEWQLVHSEELAWREMEDRLEMLKEMEKTRGE